MATSYSTVQLLSTELSVDIAFLNAKDESGDPTPAAIRAKENVEDLIAYASEEVRRRIGYEPVQPNESTKTYQLRVVSDVLYLKEPVRPSVDSNNNETGVSVQIGGGTTYWTNAPDAAISMPDINTIRLPALYQAGTKFSITGRFGNYTSVADLQYSDIQSATNAIAYQYLFKGGTPRSTTQGTTTYSTTNNNPWVGEENIKRLLGRYIKYYNLE